MLQYVFKYLHWPLVSSTRVFQWLAARGPVLEVMQPIIQHVVFFLDFYSRLTNTGCFDACQWAGPDFNCSASHMLFDEPSVI